MDFPAKIISTKTGCKNSGAQKLKNSVKKKEEDSIVNMFTYSTAWEQSFVVSEYKYYSLGAIICSFWDNNLK